jgi:SOS-response transcriptional repressor LexA
MPNNGRQQQMNKYLVTASSISYFTLEIEAESVDEAFQLGKEADGSDFARDGEGDWVIVDVKETA